MSVERGSLLFNTGRLELAENEFRAALAQDPQNALAHAMLGLCLLRREQYADATAEVEQAIHLRPDWAFAYQCLATILSQRKRLKPALAAANEAVRLDPGNPATHALVAGIYVEQENWKGALASADRGLQADPTHNDCVNFRGVALVHLNRRGEASATIEGALNRNPQSAQTHANQGWALLHSGDHRAAMEHFREALRLNPEMQWAKAGIIEAMKARNPIYRVMLSYFLFMARLNPRVRWGIIIGLYVADRLLRSAAQENPAIRPLVVPVLIAYLIFVLLTWLAYPLFNLLLRFDRFGRYALSPNQRYGANLLGAWLTVTLGIAGAGWWHGSEPLLLTALVVGLSCLPASAIFLCPNGWPRWAMAGYSALALGIGLFAIYGPRMSDGTNLFIVFAYTIMFSTFVASGLARAKVQK